MRTRATEPKLSRLGELSNKVDAIVRRCLEGYDRLEGVVGDAEDANGKVANQGQPNNPSLRSVSVAKQRGLCREAFASGWVGFQSHGRSTGRDMGACGGRKWGGRNASDRPPAGRAHEKSMQSSILAGVPSRPKRRQANSPMFASQPRSSALHRPAASLDASAISDHIASYPAAAR